MATTTMPGLALCLQVGLQYSKDLLRRLPLPFIPVHHMIAHALTVRMLETYVQLSLPPHALTTQYMTITVITSEDKFLLDHCFSLAKFAFR